jgi:pimeloyl-ACP methyl ester carboxylesterase
LIILIVNLCSCQLNPLSNGFQIAEEFGYTIETHDVTTSDGYIISLWRLISPDQNDGTSGARHPIYLAHGLGNSAEGFMFHGPEQSPAFYLHNQGYDVWLYNARGNIYSTGHETLNPATDSEYWNFGIEELALDHVANVNFILQTTGQERLSLFAYSLGGASSIASASIYADFFAQRIDVLIALAPAISFSHTPSYSYNYIINTPLMFTVLRNLGIYQISGLNTVTSGLAAFTCQLFPCICSMMDVLMENTDPSLNDPDASRYLHAQPLKGTSVKVMEQIGQIGRSGRFQFFDYGPEINMQQYGSEEPSEFPLDQINIPIALFLGK